MIDGIDHVAVIVNDIEASTKDLTERLGLELIHEEIIDEAHARLAYLQVGAHVLQLVQPTGDGPLAEFLAEHGERLHHVCFAVADIESALDKLAPGPDRPSVVVGGQSRPTCFLPFQPSGLLIELAEVRPAGTTRPRTSPVR